MAGATWPGQKCEMVAHLAPLRGDEELSLFAMIRRTERFAYTCGGDQSPEAMQSRGTESHRVSVAILKEIHDREAVSDGHAEVLTCVEVRLDVLLSRTSANSNQSARHGSISR